MRKPPILPTFIVAAAMATMIALGFWQLQRAAWKDRLLAEYAAAAALPALDLDPLLAHGVAATPPIAFRRVLVTCRILDATPELRGGRSAAGQGGYAHLVPCRPGEAGLAGRIVVNAGWSALPDRDRRLTLDGVVAGRLGPVEPGRPITLTATTTATPLQPGAPTNIEDIPNNHLAYAFQWFFFAAVAVLIYVLALRRRAPKLPPEP
jgi:surfeit locus 1 family protein